MPRIRALTAALTTAGLLALTGCTDDSTAAGDPGDPGDPSASWSPTGRLETPSASPAAPTPPVLPDAAKQATEEGARAFIAYYWELINYAQATGDVKALNAASNVNCAGCNGGIQKIRKHYRDGGHVVGGEHTFQVTEINRLNVESGELTGFHATVATRHGAQTLVARDGAEEVNEPGDASFERYLLWTSANQWRVDVLEIR